MVYLVTKNDKFLYLVKNIRVGPNKWKKITKYLGKNSPDFNYNEAIKQYSNYFKEKELEIRLNEIKKLKLGYNDVVLPKIEEINSNYQYEIISNSELNIKIKDKFLKDFIYNSNKIEGSKIPYEELVKIIENEKSDFKNSNEVKEVENSKKAWEFLAEDFKFTETSIKKLYAILTKDLIMVEHNILYPKGYKKYENVVGGNKTTPPEKVKEEMIKLLTWYKTNKKVLHPIKLAFEFHMKYLIIHPFQDGNGRTARMIMNKILEDNNYLPIIIYKSKSNKMNLAMNKYRNNHKIKYFTFMLSNMKKTYLELYDLDKKKTI